jgi:autotransporter-associated beta strand protein
MKIHTKLRIIRDAGGLLLALLSASAVANAATTNTFVFNNTVVGIGAGPANPASGPVAFSGTNLTAGDVVVFDGIVIDVPGSTADAWGAINLNAGGYLGLTGASLGVLAETGTASGNDWQLFLNGSGTSTHFGSGAADAGTNRVRIELTCAETGSTTNMSYLVEVDQGVSGTFNSSLSGTGVNFANNTIVLTFGANAHSHQFIQNQPLMSLSAVTPATNAILAGFTATFNANITAGWPVSSAQQWLSNGVPIPGATSLSYTTPPVSASYDGVRYSVVVTNLLNPTNVVTSSVAVLKVHATPGIIPFNFATTTVAAGYGTVTDPGVSISGSQLLAGDTVVFDGIVTPNGGQGSDAWTAINVGGAGYGNVTGAKLGVLCRLGTGPSQLFIDGSGSSNPTSGGAPTNRVRIELYPSASGSTTNMGWMVEIDQNLSGTFQPAVTGTNLTFANNTLPLSFGSSGASAFVTQDPQSPVSIFSGPNPAFQVVAAGAPVTVGISVLGWSPAFQWRKNGVAIPNATNRVYTLAAATLADNGDKFTVVVSNRLDSLNVVTSTVANVSVLIPNNLSWDPVADGKNWDAATKNWSTNGGVAQIAFANGNNVTFDSLGYGLGSTVSIPNTVNPNAVTVNVSGETYQFGGVGSVSGQSLLLTGDGTGTLGLGLPVSFANVVVDTGSTLQVGNGVNADLQAVSISNNGSIYFNNAGGTLSVAARITGSGSVIQSGSGTTVLSATNSVYSIAAINAGTLCIASAPTGVIVNNSELQPNGAADFAITNMVTGIGHFYFTGFQTTLMTGLSDQSGQNRIQWSKVIVDNPQALGDTTAGATIIGGADNIGGLYLSNNIAWSQELELDPRQGDPAAAATTPHLGNISGTNEVDSLLTFATGQGGSQINVDVAAGQLTINSVVGNYAINSNRLNLQGAGSGIWNGALSDGPTAGTDVLHVLKRGTGVWALSGANTYSGLTTVANGTLLINGQISAGDVSVESGATLGGVGTIAGPVAVAAGGTIAPGTGSAVLTVNNTLTLADGSFTRMQVNKTAATKDQIVGVSALTYAGTLVVNNQSGALTTSDSFKLFDATSYSGAFASITPGPGAGLAWDPSTLATDGTLRIKAGATVDTTPFKMTYSVIGGNTLLINWPASHIGWTLLAQTNATGIGLGTNWFAVPGSTTVSQMSFPFGMANGSVFYRMVYTNH